MIMPTVMVVDDDELQLVIAADMLSSLGVQRILTARNGHEALAMLESPVPDPDLVLSDLAMPNSDGVELMNCLAQHNYEGSIALMSNMNPVILECASKLARQYRLKLLGVLAKPLRLGELRELLMQAASAEP